MTALVIVGFVVGAVVLLVLPVGLALVVRQRRVECQPVFGPYRPGPPGRRERDRRAHPDEADTQEIPRVESRSND